MAKSNKDLIAEACKRLDVKESSLLASAVNRERGTVAVITADHAKHVFTIEELSAPRQKDIQAGRARVDEPKPTIAKTSEPKPDKA